MNNFEAIGRLLEGADGVCDKLERAKALLRQVYRHEKATPQVRFSVAEAVKDIMQAADRTLERAEAMTRHFGE